MATNKEERIADEMVDRLLERWDPATVFETGGLVDELKKRLAERMPASWKERGRVALAVKPIYQAESAAAARERLEDFDRGPWGQKYPAIAQSWRRNWKQAISVLRLRA